MRIINMSNKHWFHNGQALKISGDMVCHYDFQYIRHFILDNGITSLDINGQNETGTYVSKAPFPWSEYVYINDAIKLLEALSGTLVFEINLAENCQQQFSEVGLDDIDRFVDALSQTQIHTLNLTGCTFLDALTWGAEAEREYDDQLLNRFITKLRGTQVTNIIGIEHPELVMVLQENMKFKKDKLMALGQASFRAEINHDLLNAIISFMPESIMSGPPASGFAFENYNSNAYGTALSAVAMASNKYERYMEGWQQTGSVLRGEETYLGADARFFRRATDLVRLGDKQHADNEQSDLADKSQPVLLIKDRGM